VSKRDEKLSDAPTSIFVITSEDIRRSGATSLPEALRLAPNLQVARISADEYAISARGGSGHGEFTDVTTRTDFKRAVFLKMECRL
jgi:iron complex outermembrane recepter protein